MAGVDFAAGQGSEQDGRRRRRRRGRLDLTPESPEERAAQRGPRARRAAASLASGGPWEWGWRRRRRRGRMLGCGLWALTLLIVFLVLSLLFGGFNKGTKVGGSGPDRPAVTRAVPARSGPLPG